MTKARTMTCKCCFQVKPMKGWRAVMGVGRACADCVEQINAANIAKQAALKAKAPKQREHKDLGPWIPSKVQGKPNPAAQRDPRAVVYEAPKFDARFQVDPDAKVVGGFASMGIGRYIGEAA